MTPLTETAAAAAVVGADVWMLASGAPSFSRASGGGPGAASALAGVLQRAAGRTDWRPVDLLAADAGDAYLIEFSAWVPWLSLHGDASEVLLRVADDLACGWQHHQLRSAAAAAALTAEHLQFLEQSSEVSPAS